MIIVDGYNVIYRWRSLVSYTYDMELARKRLVNILSDYTGYTGEDVTVVFDSSLRRDASLCGCSPENIRVIYAPRKEGADIFIEKMVYSNREKGNITVVTGDTLERLSVVKNGACVLSPEVFEEEVRKCRFLLSEGGNYEDTGFYQ